MGITRGMFSRVSSGFNIVNPNLVVLEKQMNADDLARIRSYVDKWNYFDGFHWEDIEESDKPEVTENWCRRFVNKFIASEFNDGFSFKFNEKVEEEVLPFLNEVWEGNKKDLLIQQLGQMKGVTGDAFLHVHFEPKYIDGKLNPDFDDPFDEYEEGRIRLFLVPSSICFPQYADGYDTSAMESCTIMFPVRETPNVFGGGLPNRYHIKRFVYTKNEIVEYEDKEELSRTPNPYGVIPIVHFKNLSLAGRHFGLSDLEDLIPLNTELNLKNSDTSEILDYHASPITVIFGARVGQLEKGANKIWAGLPKDAKVQNIELNSDLGASSDYRDSIKKAMHEISGVPELATGSGNVVSNLSGVALQIAFMPLVDTIKMKRANTKESLKLVNKIVLKIARQEGLLTVDESIKNKDIFNHEVIFSDILPKDMMLELQQIQQEMKAGLEDREGAMKRLKKDNIQEKLTKIETERKETPMMYGVEPVLVANGQILVNPETGETITDNMEMMKKQLEQTDKQMELTARTAEIQAKAVGANSPNKEKPVGVNAKGQDAKVNAGFTNKNEGKKE
jgi:hypothetical protein